MPANSQSGVIAIPRPIPVINPWIIAMTVMLATFMEVLDTTVVNVSLPHVAGSLSASVDESTWALTSYLVANAIILPMGGWFSMAFGRKKFYMICVALFTVSSFLCGIAPSLEMLILFRVMQGLGGGALQPIAQAILVESFPHEKRGMAMAVYGMGVVAAPIIGPTLGGWITDNYSWRWVFFINIPVGVLSLLLTSALIHDPIYMIRKRISEGLKIDYIGFGLLAVGLGSLEVVLDEGQKMDWFGSHFIVAFVLVTAVCLVSVVFWELRQKEPVIDFRVLKDRNFALSTVTMLVMGFVLYGSTTLLPLFLQTLLGYTSLLSGKVLSPGGIVIVFCMPMVGLLLKKVQARWLVVFGVLCSVMGLLIMSRFTLGVDFRTAVWSRVVQSLGLGFLFVPISTIAFAFVAKERTNYATGIFNLARNIGGSTGIAMVTTVLARRSQFHQYRLSEKMSMLEPAYRNATAAASQLMVAHGASPPDAQHAAHGLMYGNLLRQAGSLAFMDAFWLMAMLFLLIIGLMFLMKKVEPGKAPVMAE
jgi:MFS transporter, DHA2 family, multidrug resistance protein